MSWFNRRATQFSTPTDGGKLATALGQQSSRSRSSYSRSFCTQCHFDIKPFEGILRSSISVLARCRPSRTPSCAFTKPCLPSPATARDAQAYRTKDCEQSRRPSTDSATSRARDFGCSLQGHRIAYDTLGRCSSMVEQPNRIWQMGRSIPSAGPKGVRLEVEAALDDPEIVP